jgi:hypothetical protein
MMMKPDCSRGWLRGTTTAIQQLWVSQLVSGVFCWCSTCLSSREFTTIATGIVEGTQLLLAHRHQLLRKAFPCHTDPNSVKLRPARPLRHPLRMSLRYMNHRPPTQPLPKVHRYLSPHHPQDSVPLRALIPPARHQCLLSDPHPPTVEGQ